MKQKTVTEISNPRSMPWIYTDRRSRARWIAEKYAQYLEESVLDVGGYNADLEQFCKASFYCNTDIAGHPNLFCNLDRSGLPFRDGSFSTVVCTEVLEHLEKAHFIFDELARVAQSHIIISLPNPWASARALMLRGRSPGKFYGLPVEPPPDRHRWFFDYYQAVEFITYRSEKNNVAVLEISGIDEEPAFRQRWQSKVVRLLPKRMQKNLFSPWVWALLQKRP